MSQRGRWFMELSATSNVSQGSHGSIYPALFSHSGGRICATYLCPQRREKRLWFNGESLARLSASPSFPAIVRTFSPRRHSERLMELRIGGRTSLACFPPDHIALFALSAPSIMQSSALVAAWDPLPGTATFRHGFGKLKPVS